jgi:Uma2 family endonuclease
MSASTAEFTEAIQHLQPGGTLVMTGVAWEDYEDLLAQLGEGYAARVSYDRGRLEIMSPSSEHEKYKELMLGLADVIADVMDSDLESFGSTTFKSQKLAKGSEPDTCFYVENAASVTGKRPIDLAVDPPPDVAVEVDISHNSFGKFPFYADIGVPEIWRCDEAGVEIYHLSGRRYVEANGSRAFPFLTSEILSEYLERAKTNSRAAVLRSFRAWLRSSVKLK